MHVHSRRGFLAQTLGAGSFGATVMEQAVLRAGQARAQSTTTLAVWFDLEYVEFVSATLVRYSSDFPRKGPAEVLAEAVQENVAGTYRALERT